MGVCSSAESTAPSDASSKRPGQHPQSAKAKADSFRTEKAVVVDHAEQLQIFASSGKQRQAGKATASGLAFVVEPDQFVGVGVDELVHVPLRSAPSMTNVLRSLFSFRTASLPLWHTGMFVPREKLVAEMQHGDMIVLHGSRASVYGKDDFQRMHCSTTRPQLLALYDDLLLTRGKSEAIQCYVGQSHHAVISVMLTWIRRACDLASNTIFASNDNAHMLSADKEHHHLSVDELKSPPVREENPARKASQPVLKRSYSAGLDILTSFAEVTSGIDSIGAKVKTRNFDGSPHQRGFRKPGFGALPCLADVKKAKEVRYATLVPFDIAQYDSARAIPAEVRAAYEGDAKASDADARGTAGALGAFLKQEQDKSNEQRVRVTVFEGYQMTVESVLFVNWALKTIRKAIEQNDFFETSATFGWLCDLPVSVRIACSAELDGEPAGRVLVAALVIEYEDVSTGARSASFSCAFHPELPPDVKDFSNSALPTKKELRSERFGGIAPFWQLYAYAMDFKTNAVARQPSAHTRQVKQDAANVLMGGQLQDAVSFKPPVDSNAAHASSGSNGSHGSAGAGKSSNSRQFLRRGSGTAAGASGSSGVTPINSNGSGIGSGKGSSKGSGKQRRGSKKGSRGAENPGSNQV